MKWKFLQKKKLQKCKINTFRFILFFRWQKIEEEVANYSEFNRNDFTVIVSPGISNSKIPLTKNGFIDLSYLSADCFHISQKSNALSK